MEGLKTFVVRLSEGHDPSILTCSTLFVMLVENSLHYELLRDGMYTSSDSCEFSVQSIQLSVVREGRLEQTETFIQIARTTSTSPSMKDTYSVQAKH